MARIEFLSSLYLNKEQQVILPDMALEAAFISGAKKHKLGTNARASLFVEGHALLEFENDKLTPDQLWEKGDNVFSCPVKVQQSRIIRTRFRADEWAATVHLTYEDTLINRQAVIDIVTTTGTTTGTFDWRPKFGRFNTEVLKGQGAIAA